jgi:signal transduction histidine kinase
MRDEGKIQVEVADWGAGLPPALQGQPFQPFFTTKQGGLGLGLSISASIVKMHGGALHLENNPEGGTIAWFTLPVQGSSNDMIAKRMP